MSLSLYSHPNEDIEFQIMSLCCGLAVVAHGGVGLLGLMALVAIEGSVIDKQPLNFNMDTHTRPRPHQSKDQMGKLLQLPTYIFLCIPTLCNREPSLGLVSSLKRDTAVRRL